jgi:hypothetical protein
VRVDIIFTKLSGQQHRVRIRRDDGTTAAIDLESRSFLRHDLAHYAVESALAIPCGFWGSVAAGAPLSGEGISGADAELAETLAGPVQTLMRDDRDTEAYLAVLARAAPALATTELAAKIHECIRRLRGHWKATPYGGEMQLAWPE